MSTATVASWMLEDFVAGGLIDNVDVEWTNCRFGYATYTNFAGAQPPAFIVDLKEIKGGEVHPDQFWTVGDANDFAPSQNGKQLVIQGAKAGLTKNSNFHFLVQQLANVGVPLRPEMVNDISLLNGLKVHMDRIPGPKRDNLPNQQEGKERKNDGKILAPTKLVGLPAHLAGAAGAVPGAQSTATASTTAAPAAANGAAAVDTDALALESILDTLKANNNATTIAQCKKNAMLKYVKSPAVRSALVTKIDDRAWLETQTAFVVDEKGAILAV